MRREEKEEAKSVEKTVAEAEKKGEVIKHEREMTYAERRAAMEKRDFEEKLASWKPKTKVGKAVKSEKLKDIDFIFEKREEDIRA